MPSNELGVKTFDHVIEGKPLLLLRQPGIEDDLEEEVAQFVFEAVKIALVDRIDNLVSFLQEQTLHGIIGLSAVPGTPVRSPQMAHEFRQLNRSLSSQNPTPPKPVMLSVADDTKRKPIGYQEPREVWQNPERLPGTFSESAPVALPAISLV
jgi:hypothetical protein